MTQYPDIYDPERKTITNFLGCYFHGHNKTGVNKKIDPQIKSTVVLLLNFSAGDLFSCYHPVDCPSYPHGDPEPKTKSGRTFKEENAFLKKQIRKLKKQCPDVLHVDSIWHCEFNSLVTRPENTFFREKIQPNLIHFERLQPRQALFGGIRQLYKMKWLKSENPHTNLYYLDINSAYSEAARLCEIPFGNYEILIDEKVEKFVYEDGQLIDKSSQKIITSGFVKALVIQNENMEPFFPVRLMERNKQRTYHPSCFKCLVLKSDQSCNHDDKDRAIGNNKFLI